MAPTASWPPAIAPAPATIAAPDLDDLVRDLDREEQVIQVLVALALAAALALALLTLGTQLAA